VALDGRQQRVLFVGGPLAQAMGERGTNAPGSQLLLAAHTQTAADGVAALDPLAALAELARHRGHVVLIVIDQRTDHPRLVQRGQGAHRGIGRQQQALVLGGQRRGFDHHRQLTRSLLRVRTQALEAVEHLEATVGDRHHTNGQRGRLTCEATAWAAGSQARVAGAQLRDGHYAQRSGGGVHGHGQA